MFVFLPVAIVKRVTETAEVRERKMVAGAILGKLACTITSGEELGQCLHLGPQGRPWS